jgi:LytS/YehU family sensor histidine kinase
VLLALSAQLFSWILSKPPKPTFDQLSFLMNVLNWSRYIAVWLLIYFLFKYMRQKMQTDKAQLRTTVELQHAQLEILRLQLNPHFLFNALNSIRSLIITDAEQARAATTLLSQLLRHTLNYEKQQFITLEQEIGIVKDYLSLEKIRFDERLHFLFEVPADALPTKVPPSILLTLAENAIKHGISKEMKGGHIYIISDFKDDHHDLIVRNTGRINGDIHGDGFGLSSTRNRLQLLYGEKASFTITNLSSYEVAAHVILPVTI